MARGNFPTGGVVNVLTNPLTLEAFSADMKVDKTTGPAEPALQAANISDPSVTLPDHLLDNQILNALTVNANPHVPQSIYVEFLWETSGDDVADFLCQVNFEEIGSAGTSLDFNETASTVPFVSGTTNYKKVVSVDIGTTGGQLLPGLYSVTALFFVEMNGSKALGGFAEVGKIMVS